MIIYYDDGGNEHEGCDDSNDKCWTALILKTTLIPIPECLYQSKPSSFSLIEKERN